MKEESEPYPENDQNKKNNENSPNAIESNQSNKKTELSLPRKRIKKGFSYHCGDKPFIKTFFKLFLPSSGQNLAVIFVIFINNFYLATFCNNGSVVKTGLGLADPILSFCFIVLVAWLNGVTVMLSQYYGNNELRRIQQIVVYSFISSIIIMLPLIILLGVIPQQLISMTSGLPITDHTNNPMNPMNFGSTYMSYLAWTYIPLFFSEPLADGLQITEKPNISFIGALLGTAISIIFDPIAIVLTKHDPFLSVKLVASIDGIARVIQLVFLLLYIWIKKYEPLYIFKKIIIEKEVWTKSFKYGLPSFINDFLFGVFATLQSIIILNFSNNTIYGDIQVSTTNATLIMQFSNVIWPGMGAATAVLVGSVLGNGDVALAKQNAKRALLWSFIVSVSLSLCVFILSFFINGALDHGIDIAAIKTSLDKSQINILSMHLEWVLIPIILSQGVFSILYYSVRCGGTKLVVLCDSVIMGLWTIMMAALTLTHQLNKVNPVAFLFMVQCEQIIRLISSFLVFGLTKWARVLTNSPQSSFKTVSAENVIY